MLVFSPASLPRLFDTLITNFRPSVRNSEPANALYMLARFACLACDHTWVEELVMGATDAIEDVAFVCRRFLLHFNSANAFERRTLTISHIQYSGSTIARYGCTSCAVTHPYPRLASSWDPSM